MVLSLLVACALSQAELPAVDAGLDAGFDALMDAGPDGGEVAVDAGPVIEPPEARCTGAPEYPASERSSSIQGTVALRITLSPDGGVTERQVVSSTGPAFDAAALRSLESCQLIPAKVDGVPAASLIELTIEFVPPVLPWTLAGEGVGAGLGDAIPGANE